MNTPTSIDDLPPEMICELFKHLHLKDLAACSQVSKRWHSIYVDFKVQRLVVFDRKGSHIREWYQSGRRVEDHQLCHSDMFNRLAELPLLSSLKHLALCLNEPKSHEMNQLNRFSQLVHLEMGLGNAAEEKVHLSLPRMKVLVFHQINERCPLSIDCPVLSALFYRGEPEDKKLLDVKRPETIKKLDTRMFGAKLDPFKSIECLVARQFGLISKSTLLSLPKLKELHYDQPISAYFEDHTTDFDGGAIGTFERMKQTLRMFLDDVAALRRSDFRFRFAGFQLIRPTNSMNSAILDSIDFGLQLIKDLGEKREFVFDEYVYLKNYELIDPDCTLDFIRVLNYIPLMRSVTGEIPMWFFEKFARVYCVTVVRGPVQDEAHLLWFLKSLRSVESLHLRGPKLSQEFYDQLPAYLPSLRDLNSVSSNEPPSNFDFISKLPDFMSFDITFNFWPSMGLLTSLLRLPAKLDAELEFVFFFRGYFGVRKERGSMKWAVAEVSGFYNLMAESEDPEEILNFLKKLEQKQKSEEDSELY